AQHPFLDLGQLVPVHVLKNDGLADPERLAVQLEHALTTIVLDHVVVADGDHPLAHLVARGFAPLAPFFAPAPEHCVTPIRSSRRPVMASRSQCPSWQLRPTSPVPATPTLPGPAVAHP